jgi:glycosyltransferase involved in cell wall biosynthesis
MVHQGAELYGSDRSFISTVKAINSTGESIVDVILPEDGKLSAEISEVSRSILFRPNGYLRKSKIKKSPFSSFFSMFSEFLWFIKKFRDYDVLYVNTVVCLSAIIALVFFRRKKNKIIHVREIPIGFQLVFFKCILRVSGASIIYNSKATMNSFGVNGVVVLNGVSPVVNDVTLFDKNKLSKLLIIGRINSWKGQDFFLNSIITVKNKLEIRIVGGVYGDQHHFLDELHTIVANNNLNVEFFEFCDDPAEHFLWADYVVVPSKDPEPFGRVAIEAMSAGKPVIASKHGGLCEIVEHGRTGYLFKPNDSMDLVRVLHEALENEDYLEMSSNARNVYLNKFSEEAYKFNFIQTVSS